ncbi:MAG: helix-turn-helix transcriptional regulator [Archangiaceae bacterium]|nr:helix-turn-helix transcriptional regulator [Archangiaceae bacterium]
MEGLTSERWTGPARPLFAAILASAATLAAIDLALDLGAGTTARHVWLEGGLLAAALGASAWLTAQLVASARARRRLERDASGLRRSLEAARDDAERWRRDASRWTVGLGEAIDQQLTRWGLTPAEKEVALLLLKGLSHREIAQLRNVGESSVRQQARAAYRKAGLQGRSELSAFFLEDLLAPRTQPPSPAEETSHE